MQNMFVLYDPRCELCFRCKLWLQSQKQRIALTFIEAASEDAKRIFPNLEHARTLDELTVIADNGAVYRDIKAWLIVLWCLADYRGWAHSLSSPDRMPMAKKFITLISDNRKAISNAIPNHKRA